MAEGRRLRPVADPWRRPLTALQSLASGGVGIGDALRTARLRHDAVRAFRAGALDPDGPAAADERTTCEELAARGFSAAFIRRFFVPFFGGVFLERRLETAAPVFLFDFAMFALGRACLPRGGMAAIPAQLAAALPAGSLQIASPVQRVEPGRVTLADGSVVTARHVVVATDASAAAALLPAESRGAWAARRQKPTRLVAFAATRSPLDKPVLVVSAEDDGPIDNLTVPSDVAEGYAPAGAALVQVSIREDWTGAAAALPDDVRRQAATWFGAAAHDWKHLATVAVPRALPDESPAARRARPRSPLVAPGLFVCGDHVGSASINGALVSGRRCAEAVLGRAVR